VAAPDPLDHISDTGRPATGSSETSASALPPPVLAPTLANTARSNARSCRSALGGVSRIGPRRRVLSVTGSAVNRGWMTIFAQLGPAGEPAARVDPLRLAAAAYLARFTGLSRTHAESDLRIFLNWCAERCVSTRLPLAERRSSCTCGGCRRCAGSSPRRCPGG
jgi:hypothetical protein